MQVDPWATGQLLVDPHMIVEAIRQHSGIQLRPLGRPVYRKPDPD